MPSVSLDFKSFDKKINNIIQYSFGFLDGVNLGKNKFLSNLSEATIEALGEYVDSEARANPAALHHVYEWYKEGSPAARLFSFKATVTNSRIYISSDFRQSLSIATNSKEPFYNKAMLMENGAPITIKPEKSSVLAFTVDGEEVFTKNEVTVKHPGGQQTAGSFERIFDEFMTSYFKQSFLRASGLYDYIKRPKLFKQNFAEGSRGGRSIGVSTGYRWIASAKIGVE